MVSSLSAESGILTGANESRQNYLGPDKTCLRSPRDDLGSTKHVPTEILKHFYFYFIKIYKKIKKLEKVFQKVLNVFDFFFTSEKITKLIVFFRPFFFYILLNLPFFIYPVSLREKCGFDGFKF